MDGSWRIGKEVGELHWILKRKTELEEARKKYMSDVNHELKTPIALISSYAEGIKEGISENPEDTAYYCDVIIDEADMVLLDAAQMPLVISGSPRVQSNLYESCNFFDDVPDEMITHHFWDSKAHACMWCGEDEKVEIEDLADYGNAAEETKCISGEEGSGSHHLVVEKDLYNPEYHFLVCHSCNSYTAEAHVPSEWTSRWIYYHDMPCDVCGISYRRGPHRDTDNDGKCDDCGYPAKVCNHEGKLIQYIWTTSYTHTRCCLLCGMRFETEPHKIRNGVCVLCGMKEPQVCNHEEGVEYKAGIVLPDCENEHDVCCRICGACLSVEPHVIGDIQTPNGQEISGCVLCGYYLLP